MQKRKYTLQVPLTIAAGDDSVFAVVSGIGSQNAADLTAGLSTVTLVNVGNDLG